MPPSGGAFSHGSPQRISYRTLSAILSQLISYFKENDIFHEPEKDAQTITLSLDKRIVTGARKITSQPFGFSRPAARCNCDFSIGSHRQ
jgi:hypothetical protein